MREPTQLCPFCGDPMLGRRTVSCGADPCRRRRQADLQLAWKAESDERGGMVQPSRPCDGCGAPVVRTRPSGQIKQWCDTCRPPVRSHCLTCGAPVAVKSGTGVAYTYSRYCSDECTPACAVGGCEKPMKYRTEVGRLCPMHYRRWTLFGDVGGSKPTHDFSPPPDACRYCGGPRGDGYQKWFCSPRCAGRDYRGIDPELEWPCAQCGRSISAQNSRRDAKKCPSCRSVRPCLTVDELALRDGAVCGICSNPVDMELSGRELLGPVVDHVLPRAHGGPNTPDNVQLAHMVCNARKQDRIAG